LLQSKTGKEVNEKRQTTKNIGTKRKCKQKGAKKRKELKRIQMLENIIKKSERDRSRKNGK
jgi:hypothetical protein